MKTLEEVETVYHLLKATSKLASNNNGFHFDSFVHDVPIDILKEFADKFSFSFEENTRGDQKYLSLGHGFGTFFSEYYKPEPEFVVIGDAKYSLDDVKDRVKELNPVEESDC